MKIITEAYVSFETAKLLKEKGFDEGCLCVYYDEDCKPTLPYNNEFAYKCPTQQMAMKWLREVHHLHVVAFCPLVDMDSKEYGVTYNLVISDLNNNCLAVDTGLEDIEYNSYELAIQEGIEYCLEHLI